MDLVLHDIRVATRALLARPAFSVVAVLTLALGVGATTALFSVVHGVLLRSLPFDEPERLVALWQTAKDNPRPSADGSVAHVNYLDWKRDARTLESVALYSSAQFTVTGLGDADVVPGAIVTTDFFKVFGATPVMGREFTPDEDRPNGPLAVVVGHAFWRDRLAGRADVIGSTLELSGRSRQVVGVAPEGFDYPHGARLWQPAANDNAACGRACVYLNGIGRLAIGATAESARTEMQALASRLEQQYPDANTNVTIGLTSLRDLLVGDIQRALWILLGAVMMVLLIACANVANLLLVRGAARQGELAVRTALGASRARMVRFLLTESFVLALVGAGAGLLLGWWGVDALKRLAPSNIPRLDQVGFDAVTFLFAGGVATVTALLFGVGPAISIARTPVSSLLGTRGRAGGQQHGRAALLVTEVALSFMLLAGAGLLVRSMVRLQAIDPGWTSDGITVFTVALPAARYPQPADVVRTFEQMDERFGGIPGVESVARINGLPLGSSVIVFSFARADRPAPQPGQEPSALFRAIDAEYLRTAGIALIAGRDFDARDRQGALPVAIVSRELADELWRGEDPIGKQIRFTNTSRTIVGVAEGVRSTNLQARPQPEMYIPHAQTANRAVTFFIRSRLPVSQVIAAARDVVRTVDSRLPVIQPRAFAELERNALAGPRFNLVLLTIFAVLALALAAVGIYGVVAYTVTQRRREIGVRMALGAEAREVLRLVMWQGLKPAAIGIVFGALGAFASGRVLTRLLYEVQPRDPLTMVGAMLTLLLVVCTACAVPAYRATRIPPATALRAE